MIGNKFNPYPPARDTDPLISHEHLQETDPCLFDLIGIENKMTRYESRMLPKQKVTRKLIEEIYTSPLPPSRPNPLKLKPSRYALKNKIT